MEGADAEQDQPPDVNLIECFGDVQDQRDRGTCVAHASCAVMECQQTRLNERRLGLSEQFGYWNAKSQDGFPNQEGARYVAMPQGAADGVCLEETWAYVPQKKAGDEAQGPPPNGAEAEAANHTLVGPQLGPRDSAAICAALDAGQPVAISVPVYNNGRRTPPRTPWA